MFSDIVQRFDVPLNALYQERDARRAQGKPVIDLVSGNVNRAGFVFPTAVLKRALAQGIEHAQIYTPDPLGQKVAREAVHRYYRSEGITVPANHIVLTSGTSLSYAYLFKLLANPGDEILCPTPSYPLLDSIAELCDVRLTKYRLREKARWEIDFDDLHAHLTPQTKAIVLISPHNPTGAVATEQEIGQLGRIATERNLPIISDEVFSSFAFNAKRLPRPASHRLPLVFTLNGLSKMFALPGMKVGWIAVTGDQAAVKKSIQSLDMISDAFLPVNEAIQFALPALFQKGKVFLKRYQQAVKQQAETAIRLLKNIPGLSFIPPEGGFYLSLRLESKSEETVALDLLREKGYLVHPGYFYDMEGDHLVFSFIPIKKDGSRKGAVLSNLRTMLNERLGRF